MLTCLRERERETHLAQCLACELCQNMVATLPPSHASDSEAPERREMPSTPPKTSVQRGRARHSPMLQWRSLPSVGYGSREEECGMTWG